MDGIIIDYVRERNFKHFSFNKRFVESVWPAEYKKQKFPKFSVLSFDEAIRGIPEIPDRKILRFTGFFNLLKSGAQSSEYLFKKLKIVSWCFSFGHCSFAANHSQGECPQGGSRIKLNCFLRFRIDISEFFLS